MESKSTPKERFEKKFVHKQYVKDYYTGKNLTGKFKKQATPKKVVAFIESELSIQKEQIIKMCEEMKKEFGVEGSSQIANKSGYNRALLDIINQIKSL